MTKHRPKKGQDPKQPSNMPSSNSREELPKVLPTFEFNPNKKPSTDIDPNDVGATLDRMREMCRQLEVELDATGITPDQAKAVFNHRLSDNERAIVEANQQALREEIWEACGDDVQTEKAKYEAAQEKTKKGKGQKRRSKWIPM